MERFNGTIWKTMMLALKARGLPPNRWESVQRDSLHTIRSLLCTAANCTPHERLFSCQRRAAYGSSLPTWLTPSKVLLRRFVRPDKHSPLVEEVELTAVNPTYAHIRYPDGRESTVALKHLAPSPRVEEGDRVAEQGRSQDFSKGGAEVMEAKALKTKSCLWLQ